MARPGDERSSVTASAMACRSVPGWPPVDLFGSDDPAIFVDSPRRDFVPPTSTPMASH
jgi:hypothetical protein